MTAAAPTQVPSPTQPLCCGSYPESPAPIPHPRLSIAMATALAQASTGSHLGYLSSLHGHPRHLPPGTLLSRSQRAHLILSPLPGQTPSWARPGFSFPLWPLSFRGSPEPLLLPSSRTSVPTAWDVPQVSGRKERGSSSPGCFSTSSPRIPGHTAHRVPGTGPGACCTPKSPSLELPGHRSPKAAKAGKSKPIRPSPTSWPGKGPPKASSSPGPSGCPAEDEIGTPNPSLCRWPA